MPSVLQGYLERGRQEGIVLCLQKLILRNIQKRFGSVPEDVAQNVKGRTDEVALDSLLESISDCNTLDDFREQL